MIDRIIDKNSILEKKKYEKIALSQLRIPTHKHITFLFNLYKSTATIKPEREISDVKDLFSDDYFLQLAFLDFSQKAPVYPSMEYYDYCFMECSKFKISISNTLEKYSIHLSSYAIELIENIFNSQFLSLLIDFKSIRDMDKREGFKRDQNYLSISGMNDQAKEYSKLIINLVEMINSNLEYDKKIKIDINSWSETTAPKIGSGRIK
ncbi:MAG: hypothetical protein KJ571_08505 [Bacteroidetes bacterium]|nr:hypothetical protein [Bacteroidota bacterium]